MAVIFVSVSNLSVSNAGMSGGAEDTGGEQAGGPRPQRAILLDDFDFSSGPGNLAFLCHALPDLLRMYLLRDQSIQAIRSRNINKKESCPNVPKGPKRDSRLRDAFRDQYKNATEHYHVAAKLVALGREVLVVPTLTKLSDRTDLGMSEVHVNFDHSEPFRGIGNLANEILAAVAPPEQSAVQPHRVAVACFVAADELTKSEYGSLGEELAFSLYEAMATVEGLDSVGFDELFETTTPCADRTNVRKLALQVDAVAVIGGEFSVADDVIEIRPRLYLRDLDSVVDMEALKGTESQIARNFDRFLEDGQKFVRATLDSSRRGTSSPLRDQPLAPEDAVALASNLIEQGEFQLAKPLAKRALQELPADAQSHFVLGKVYLAEGKFQEAVDKLERAVLLNDRYEEAYIALDQALSEQNRFAEAVSHLLTAKQQIPKSTDVRRLLGLAAVRAGQYDIAVENLATVDIVSGEHGPQTIHFLAVAERERGNVQEAIDWYGYGLELLPNDPLMLGELLKISRWALQLDQFEAAIRGASLYIRSKETTIGDESTDKKGTVDALLVRGASNFRLSRTESAVNDYQIAIGLMADQRSEAPESGDPGLVLPLTRLSLSETCLLLHWYQCAVKNSTVSMEELSPGTGMHLIARFYAALARAFWEGISPAEEFQAVITKLATLDNPTRLIEVTISDVIQWEWSFAELRNYLMNQPPDEPIPGFVGRALGIINQFEKRDSAS